MHAQVYLLLLCIVGAGPRHDIFAKRSTYQCHVLDLQAAAYDKALVAEC
jgi:hypothetical protein